MIIIVSFLEVVGSQRRRHPQPATDRPVQGTTPSRRRETPDRPIGGGKGGRRLCGRIPGSAVFLCKRRCKNTRDQHRPNQNQKTTEYKTRTETPPRKPEPKTQPSANDGKKKKTVAGAEPWCRGRGRSTGRSRSPRAGGREHKGKPKPKRFGFPQRLREKEKRRKEKTRRRRNQPDTRKEEGHIQKTKHGSGLEGLKNHNKYQPQRQKRETITKEQRPRPEQKNKQRNHTRL